MMEGSWDECLEANSSLKISPNRGKARSLIETSQGRLEFLKPLKIQENNSNYIFENYYTSILELVHALVILAGFKVNNHLCLGYYLRDILKRDDLFRWFDDCRLKRNSLIYYGKKMDYNVAKESLTEAEKLITELLRQIK